MLLLKCNFPSPLSNVKIMWMPPSSQCAAELNRVDSKSLPCLPGAFYIQLVKRGSICAERRQRRPIHILFLPIGTACSVLTRTALLSGGVGGDLRYPASGSGLGCWDGHTLKVGQKGKGRRKGREKDTEA